MSLKTAQIGRCGELLVQYQLLLRGIESAPMTTDSGVDLVAYSPSHAQPTTIQVKTNLKAKPAGGKGKPALDWWISKQTPSQYAALVDLSSQRVWLLKIAEIAELAQQKPNGRFHLCMYLERPSRTRMPCRMIHVEEFQRFLLVNRAEELFGDK